ncbi:hypothetical protein P0082_01240 [Candidatus Haliotispira prima]|uniref:Tetratricopeptide repeat protein n=1 Tax=Candidatus Haliotispira prima TaxID=3034016 RepID=A0ABY8MHQ0_9SPIO|nr:hypothetical protein P0082_01240 [Candidatus Haliotispira prima]
MEDQPQTWFERGCEANQNDEPELALGYYLKFLKAYEKGLDPKYDESAGYAYTNIGKLFYDQNRHSEACRYLNLAIKLMPNYALARYNKSLAYYGLGSFEEVLESAAEAINLDPQYIDPHLISARVHIYIHRDFPAGMKHLAKALELDISCGEAYYLRGEALYASGKLDPAFRDFRDAMLLGLPTLRLSGKAWDYARRLSEDYYRIWNETVMKMNALPEEKRRPYDVVFIFFDCIRTKYDRERAGDDQAGDR